MKTNIEYKIKKNYIKYIAKNDDKYLKNIANILDKKYDFSQKGGMIKIKTDKLNDKIDFIIENLELIINDIELFNKILNIIKKHDNLMSQINPKYKEFNYDDNVLNYLDKIYDREFNFI